VKTKLPMHGEEEIFRYALPDFSTALSLSKVSGLNFLPSKPARFT